jgi:hypothetical protein
MASLPGERTSWAKARVTSGHSSIDFQEQWPIYLYVYRAPVSQIACVRVPDYIRTGRFQIGGPSSIFLYWIKAGDKKSGDHMSKPRRQTTVEKSRERTLFVDILKQQMFDLKALRRAVATAELRLVSPRRRAPRSAARTGKAINPTSVLPTGRTRKAKKSGLKRGNQRGTNPQL